MIWAYRLAKGDSESAAERKANPLSFAVVAAEFAEKIQQMHLPTVFAAQCAMGQANLLDIVFQPASGRERITSDLPGYCTRCDLNAGKVSQPLHLAGGAR